MALPLVLSLLDAFLALAAVVMGMGVSSARHERRESSRVALAAQRGALDLVVQAAPWGALFLVLSLASGSVVSALGGTPARDLLSAGVIGAIVATGGAWLAGWQVARFTASLSRTAPLETTAAKLAQLTCSTLLLGAAVGSGLCALCFAALPETSTAGALIGAATGVGLLIVLARPGVLSWAAAGHSDEGALLHSGSLAALVGTTYTSTWLLHASLFAACAIGQIGLFTLARDAGDAVGTYALLLPRVGLFALACAGLGTRISSRDRLPALWMRQLLIALVVLGGGAWTLRGVLGTAETRDWAPALVCYLCVTFGAGTWILTTRAKRKSSFVSALALLPVLLVVVIGRPDAVTGGATAIVPIALGSALALLPLAAIFRLSGSALASAGLCDLLASGANEAEGSEAPARPAPSPDQQELFLPLAALVALSTATTSIGLGSFGQDPLGHTEPLLLGLAGLTSAFLLRGMARSEDALGQAGGRRLAELTSKQQDDGGLLLGEGLAILKRVGGQEQLKFAALLLGPPLLLTAFAATGWHSAMTMASGCLLGALFWPVLAEIPADSERPHAAHSALVWPLSFYHLGWSALVLTLGP